ncbi:MAG: hypothetical protein D4R97_08235, partial [Bacteroidetes bacterium]
DRIQVYFKNTDVLSGQGSHPGSFRIAGSDGVFRPAEALITGSSVAVYSKEVPIPQFVRYAFRNTDTASVFDKGGLPAGSFRTDTIYINYRKAVIPAKDK